MKPFNPQDEYDFEREEREESARFDMIYCGFLLLLVFSAILFTIVQELL